MTQTKSRDRRFWLALVIFSLTGQVAWTVENMYFNVFIYKMFQASAAAISTMVAASSAAATVTTLLVGALSDKVGKRKIFIVSGYIVWGLTIFAFALLRLDVIGSLFPQAVSAASLGVSLTILLDCVMTFFGSAANDACFNAWLTDSTDETNLGAAEGINSMMPLVAILVVFGGFMGFDLNQADSWSVIFCIIGSVVVAIGAAGIFLLRDQVRPTADNRNYFSNILYGFRPTVIRDNQVLYGTFLACAAFHISVQVFMPYLILYYTVTLKLDNYVFIMAPAVILAAVFTAFYGRRFDRLGFQGTIRPVIFLLMGGYVLLYLFRGEGLVFLGSLLMMCGYLGGGAIFGAQIRAATPEHKAGMFQGLRVCCAVLIPGIIGPAIGAAVLRNAETVVGDDGRSSFIPNANIFLAALAATALVWLALWMLNRRMAPQKTING